MPMTSNGTSRGSSAPASWPPARLKLVDHLKDFQTRWLKGGEWNHQDDAWVAIPSDCQVR